MADISGDQPATDDPGRHETEEQRADRQLAELLQELRVAGLGVQVLFGFLLSLPFTARFAKLDSTQLWLYVASLILAALAITLLSAPVTYHRLVFRRHVKGKLLTAANRMAIGGMVCVGSAISCAVMLVLSLTRASWPIVAVGGVSLAVFAGLWFVLPLSVRISATRREGRS